MEAVLQVRQEVLKPWNFTRIAGGIGESGYV
jgi:hypothetical protein